MPCKTAISDECASFKPVFIILPWLNPFASGPPRAVLPILFSWGCTVVLLGLRVWRAYVVSNARLALVVAAALLAAGLMSSALGLLQYFDAAAAWIL